MKGGINIATKEIKVFYSWQSDLPGNKSRYIIQESIEQAVSILRDSIKIEADRDTKNEYGSPDIVQTIFSKIDESDIFIADVSAVNKYTSLRDEEGVPEKLQEDEIRLTPNPNVLLELGYAAKTLGWDRIICVINTDFGQIEQLPFDIAHRRLTPFSLDRNTKANVKKVLAGIIVDTVTDLMINGNVKSKGNFSSHSVGCYDFETGTVLGEFSAITVRNLSSYNHLKKSILSKCKALVERISKIQLNSPEEKLEEVSANEEVKEVGQNIVLPLKESLATLMNSSWFESLSKPQLFRIKEEEKTDIQEKVNEQFGTNLDETFFCMGNLVSKPNQNLQGSTFDGTEDEIRKHDDFVALQYNFLQLELLERYLDTFNGLILIPLAITNDSNLNDEDLSIMVKADVTTAEIIIPNYKLFNEEISGLEGIIYENDFVKRIFLLPETDKIQYDLDLSFNMSEHNRRIQKTNIWGQTNYDSKDYEIEIQKYIAKPIEYDNSIVEYTVRNLRPKETKWMGSSILVKPLSNVVKLSYFIKSCSSNGELAGEITLKVSLEKKCESKE